MAARICKDFRARPAYQSYQDTNTNTIYSLTKTSIPSYQDTNINTVGQSYPDFKANQFGIRQSVHTAKLCKVEATLIRVSGN